MAKGRKRKFFNDTIRVYTIDGKKYVDVVDASFILGVKNVYQYNIGARSVGTGKTHFGTRPTYRNRVSRQMAISNGSEGYFFEGDKKVLNLEEVLECLEKGRQKKETKEQKVKELRTILYGRKVVEKPQTNGINEMSIAIQITENFMFVTREKDRKDDLFNIHRGYPRPNTHEEFLDNVKDFLEKTKPSGFSMGEELK